MFGNIKGGMSHSVLPLHLPLVCTASSPTISLHGAFNLSQWPVALYEHKVSQIDRTATAIPSACQNLVYRSARSIYGTLHSELRSLDITTSKPLCSNYVHEKLSSVQSHIRVHQTSRAYNIATTTENNATTKYTVIHVHPRLTPEPALTRIMTL